MSWNYEIQGDRVDQKRKIDKLHLFPTVEYLTFVSQELLALKTKHYRFSFHIGIFNAASRWIFYFLHYMKFFYYLG